MKSPFHDPLRNIFVPCEIESTERWSLKGEVKALSLAKANLQISLQVVERGAGESPHLVVSSVKLLY